MDWMAAAMLNGLMLCSSLLTCDSCLLAGAAALVCFLGCSIMTDSPKLMPMEMAELSISLLVFFLQSPFLMWERSRSSLFRGCSLRTSRGLHSPMGVSHSGQWLPMISYCQNREVASLQPFRHRQLVVHPLHQPHAVLELLAPPRAPQHHHHNAALEAAHERIAALQTAARLAAQTALRQQLVGVLEDADAVDDLAVVADFPGPDGLLLAGADLAEERDFEALRGQPGDVDGRAEVASEAVRVGEGAVGETHFLRVLPHQPHENGDVVLPVLVGKVEAAEVAADSFLEHVAAQVVGDGERDVVGGFHDEGGKRLLESDQRLVLGVERQLGAAHLVVGTGDEKVEVVDSDEVLLDDLVGGVEGEQFGDAGDLVRLPVLVPLDDGLPLHAVDDPLLGGDVVESDVPQHPVLVGNVRLRQLHQNWVRQNRLGIDGPPFLERAQLLGTDAALPYEQLRVVLHRLQVEDSLVEESGVVSQVLLEERQWFL